MGARNNVKSLHSLEQTQAVYLTAFVSLGIGGSGKTRTSDLTLIRRLIDQGIPGRMVNISSMAGFSTSPNSAAVLYSTTKLAIVRMTESLAAEWARHNINVNAIAPGCFSSEMLDGMLERIGDISQSFPRKRIRNNFLKPNLPTMKSYHTALQLKLAKNVPNLY